MTATTTEPAPVPMSEPTSRLHAATNALARWDNDTGSGEDIGGAPGVLQEYWDGAQAVWDALQPKCSTAADLDALRQGDVIVRHTRFGVMLWQRTADRTWWPLVTSRAASREWWTSEQLAAEYGPVRLLWTRD